MGNGGKSLGVEGPISILDKRTVLSGNWGSWCPFDDLRLLEAMQKNNNYASVTNLFR